jgi:uncharacterized membrane protein
MDDNRLENIIGNLLRAGVLLAASVVVFGGIVYLVRHHSEPANYQTFRIEGPDVRTLPGILHSAAQFRGEGLIQLGLLLLIATPIARVALAAAGFYLERDYLYVVISLIVLGVLLYSLVQSS